MTWTRLEPLTRGDSLDVGIAAAVADPLWMLGRQWQLGELTGSDGGSPLLVDTEVWWRRLTSSGLTPIDLRTTPLDPLVEREPRLRPFVPGDPDPGDWAARVRAGRALVQALRQAGHAAAADRAESLAAFPAELDPWPVSGERDARYEAVLAGRGCDAARVLALASGAISGGDPGAEAVQKRWREEVAREWGVAGDFTRVGAWVPERLEHQVSLQVTPWRPDEPALTVRAGEYDGTGFDWHAFDWAPGHAGLPTGLPGLDDDVAGTTARTVLATRLTYPGQPDDRFFAFEDAAVRIGAPDAGPTDLVKLVVAAFTTVAGPDWLLAPVELPVGCLARVTQVRVRDTFGVTVDIEPASGAGRQFEPAGDGDPHLLLLPPAVATLQSAPREEVVLQRDEGANLAWAIEHIVRGRAGGPVDRRTEPTDFDLPPTSVTEPYDAVWRVQTPVPPTWLPLVVQEGTEDDRRRLVPARLLDAPTGTLPEPASRIMAEVAFIHDEEVPRTGVRVTVHDRLVRGADGSTHVWRGRQKRPGRGEAASGLRFDDTTPD